MFFPPKKINMTHSSGTIIPYYQSMMAILIPFYECGITSSTYIWACVCLWVLVGVCMCAQQPCIIRDCLLWGRHFLKMSLRFWLSLHLNRLLCKCTMGCELKWHLNGEIAHLMCMWGKVAVVNTVYIKTFSMSHTHLP